MKVFTLSRYIVGLSAAAALLAGCGATQPSFAAPLAMRRAPSTTRASSSAYKVLHRFKEGGTDGYYPAGALIDVNGTLYGTTLGGGDDRSSSCNWSGVPGCGTVYSISTSGVEHVVHSFTGSPDGAYPAAALLDVNGTLYGTTRGGGTGHGTVFSITPSGAEHVLYSFAGAPDGGTPQASLIYANGLLYGTTTGGGESCLTYSNGCGTVFSVSTGGKETVLYRFAGGSNDGADPESDLIEVHGTFYGTTLHGGFAYNCTCGTVYSVSKSGAEKMVLRFADSSSDWPEAGLVDLGGTMYGTTSGEGILEQGPSTAYSVTPQGEYHYLSSFAAGVTAGLIAVDGTLYGTTPYGGSSRRGTVFSLTTSGEEQVLHNFTGGSDGGHPLAALLDVNETLYGTTTHSSRHNINGVGTVFALTP
jgi:uncharacterized repeat protein (TIGR03803 family)